MFLHSTARLKDGRLSQADSRKAAKDLNRRKQRKFEQKEAKLAKVRHLASERCSSGHGPPPVSTHCAISTRRGELDGSALQLFRTSPLLPSFPSVQASSSLPFVNRAPSTTMQTETVRVHSSAENPHTDDRLSILRRYSSSSRFSIRSTSG